MNRYGMPNVFAPVGGGYDPYGEDDPYGEEPMGYEDDGYEYMDEEGYDDDPQAALERSAAEVARLRAGQPGKMNEEDDVFAPIGLAYGMPDQYAMMSSMGYRPKR